MFDISSPADNNTQQDATKTMRHAEAHILQGHHTQQAHTQQALVTLDLEGVLVPEVWVAVAEAKGLDELRLTTRDEPDYDKLMRHRLDVLAANQVTMTAISEVASNISPLPGAREFLDELRSRVPVVILSDTFDQFGSFLMPRLGWPTLLCHTLVVKNDLVVGYRMRMPDPKAHAVRAFKSLNYQVAAAGDSYNDISMLANADNGFLFKASEQIRSEHPEYTACDTHDELMTLLTEATS